MGRFLSSVALLALFAGTVATDASAQQASMVGGSTDGTGAAGTYEVIQSLNHRLQVDAALIAGNVVVTNVQARMIPTSIAPYEWNQGVTTAGVADALIIATAASTRNYLLVKNESTTKDIGCRFDGTASALNTAGTVTLPPYGIVIFEGSYVPPGAVRCISSAATQPITVIAYPN